MVVPRNVEMEPVTPGCLCLEALEVRNRDHEKTTGLRDLIALSKSRHGIYNVLENVPEHDNVEMAPWERALAEVSDEDRNLQLVSGVVSGRLGEFDPVDLPSVGAHERRQQPPAASHVEHSARADLPFDRSPPAGAKDRYDLLEEGMESTVLLAVIARRIVAGDLGCRKCRKGGSQKAISALGD
jgi:hypothetical protein